MSAGQGQIIQYTDYNSIRSVVDAVMGTGATGYGQTLASSAVSQGATITALQWLNLRTDMVKARQHQIGSAVGSSSATDSRNLLLPASGLTITEALRAQFSAFATSITTNQRTIDTDAVGGQYAAEGLVTGTRSSAWNSTLTNTVTITFSDANHPKYYFNAGGKIRISANITTGTSKNNTWNTMFTQMGEFVMDYTSTTYTGSSATGSSIGYDDLTTSNQIIGQKAAPSGSYAENLYVIRARKTDTTIVLTIEFQDNDLGDPNFDEDVQPTLNSVIAQYRPSGSNVSVPSPTASQSGF
jgi:hypothetical protein